MPEIFLSFTFKEVLRSQIDCDGRRILGLVLVAKTVANKVFGICLSWSIAVAAVFGFNWNLYLTIRLSYIEVCT